MATNWKDVGKTTVVASFAATAAGVLSFLAASNPLGFSKNPDSGALYFDDPTSTATIDDASVFALSGGGRKVLLGSITGPSSLSGDVTGATNANVVTTLTGSGGAVSVPQGSFVSFGDAGVPDSGDLRLGPSGSIRSTDGSGNAITIVSIDAGTETFGGSTFTVAQVHSVKDGGTHAFQVAGATQALIGSGYISIGSAPASAGAARLSSATAIESRTAANSADISLIATNGGNTVLVGDTTQGTGLTLQAPTNQSVISTIAGTTKLTVNALGIGVGSGALAAAGDARFANNTTMAAFRNAANSADVVAISTDSSNIMYVGGISGGTLQPSQAVLGGGTVFLNVGSTSIVTAASTTITLGAATLRWASTIASPVIQEAIRASDAAAQTITVAGQDAFSTGGALTNINGGQAFVRGGAISTSTAGGLKKGFRFDLSSVAGGQLVEGTEVVAGNRVLAMCRGAALTSTEVPAGAGDLVEYHGNATTAPTVSAVSGYISYASGGSPYWMLPSNHSLGITSTAATTATNGAGELVKTNVQGYITAVIDGTTVKIPYYANFAIPYLVDFAEMYPDNDR